MSGSALIIGGGIAGIRASLDLAGMEIPVHLVECKPFLGGALLQLDRLYPTDHCAWCPVWPLMRHVGNHPLITIHSLSEVRSIQGKAGAYQATIGHLPTYIRSERCTGCGECLKACAKRSPAAGRGGSLPILKPNSYVLPKGWVIDRNLCGECIGCQEACPFKAIDFQMIEEIKIVEISTVILASGFDPGPLNRLEEYSYGAHPDIISAMEFETWISEWGPNAGQVLRPSDGQKVRHLAFVLCAGSRDRRGYDYCSAVCCMYAVKEALWACRRSKDLQATIFFTDLRACGRDFQEYVQSAGESGRIQFIRSRPGRIQPGGERGALQILYEDTNARNTQEMNVDMVVLAQPQAPPRGLEKSTFQSGSFACGCCQDPADAVQSVISASAAALRAAETIKGGRVT